MKKKNLHTKMMVILVILILAIKAINVTTEGMIQDLDIQVINMMIDIKTLIISVIIKARNIKIMIE